MIRIFTLLSVVAVLGCSKEEPVRVYDAPKPEAATFKIIGGIVSTDNPEFVWTFKVSGKSAELEPYLKDLTPFVESVKAPKFVKDDPTLPKWVLPQGWKLGGAIREKMADETILFGPADKPFVMTVGRFGGGFESNLKRWVEQVGLTWQPADSDKYARPVGTPATGWRIEITGPKNPTASGMKPPRM